MRTLDDYDVLTLPGWHGSDADHWQSHWERAFPTVRRVAQADWEQPVYADWAGRLSEAIRGCTRPVVFVAHSLGTALAVRWIFENGAACADAVAGAFLVACSDRDRWDAPDSFPSGFGPMILRALPVPAMVLASRNDPRVTPERARTFAQAWEADFADMGAIGHMGADAGLNLWPQGLVRLGGFVASLDR